MSIDWEKPPSRGLLAWASKSPKTGDLEAKIKKTQRQIKPPIHAFSIIGRHPPSSPSPPPSMQPPPPKHVLQQEAALLNSQIIRIAILGKRRRSGGTLEQSRREELTRAGSAFLYSIRF
jgi:hypothetical protein